jgi:hypothetical protein
MCSFLKRTDIYLKKVKSKEVLANIKIGVKNWFYEVQILNTF